MKTITTITPGMTGSQFIAALNNNSSVDNIGITVGSSEITTKVFDYVCDGIDDQSQINLAITEASELTNGGCVYLSSGKFYITGSIIIKTKVRLILTPQTIIYLVDDSDDYMLINDEFETGTTDFTINGGQWFGNSGNQTVTYTGGNPANTFFGFGFLFKNCERFIVENIYMHRSRTWGMAHFLCNDFIFRNIEFQQASVTKCDGITGVGCQNALIENIYGYTGDDMVAIAAIYSHFGVFNETPIEWGTGRDCKDVIIRNIKFQKSKLSGYETYETYTGIGIYATEEMTCENIIVENISGATKVGLAVIHVVNYWPLLEGKGFVKNLTVRNVNFIRTAINQPVIKFSDYDIMEVSDFNISNVVYSNDLDSQDTIIELSGSVAKANINNISAKNYAGTNKHKLITVNGEGQNITINVNAIDITSDLLPIIENTGTSTGLRVNAPDCYVDVLTEVNAPIIGDRLVEKTTYHPMLYTTKWIDIIDGSDI